MNCPKCGGKSQIKETRTTSYGRRRMRECLSCKHKFSTVEITMICYKDLINKITDVKKTMRRMSALVNSLKEVITE